MKLLKVTICILFLLCSNVVFAQQSNNVSEEDAFIDQLESSTLSLQLQEALDLNNSAEIQQIGISNIASINQSFAGVKIIGNIAELIQNGNSNLAILNQAGNNNNHLINQSGNANTLETMVMGDNNFSTIEQTGNANVIHQELLGNDMAFILAQFGNNNQIIQLENDRQSHQYQVLQNGDGMKVTIINNGAYSP